MNRRDFLRKAPVAAAAIVAPNIASAAVCARERVYAAIAELKSSMEAFDPTIKGWIVHGLDMTNDQKQGCRILITAFDN